MGFGGAFWVLFAAVGKKYPVGDKHRMRRDTLAPPYDGKGWTLLSILTTAPTLCYTIKIARTPGRWARR